MGFFEDDRIRRKNVVHNQAQQLYDNLRKEGLSNTEIQQYVTGIQPADPSRNEIHLAVLYIAKGDQDGEST